ncbi:MAG: ABC transporter ATP-binding protein [Candidatus Woesearchaeota archaeon]
MSPSRELLRVEDVRFERDKNEILKGISFSVNKGELLSIVGPNGSGKSTIASIIMGIKKQDSGRIFFNGKEISKLSISQRSRLGISMAWQEPARFEGLTVREYLSINAKLSPEEALSHVGMRPEEYLDRVIDHTLSGGERKRIELASMLALKPKLVILDEPDSGIDFASLKDLVRVLKKMREEGSSVVLITHREEVAKHADRALLICAGKIVKSGDSSAVSEYFRKECAACTVEDADKKSFERDKNGLQQ